jgi:sensor histidine kinase YesM
MKESAFDLRKQILNIGIILSISIFITFIFAGFNTDMISIALNIVYGVIIGLSIAIGSSAISKKMFSMGDWKYNPIKKYISVIAAITTYIIVDIIIVNIVWFTITQDISVIDLLKSNMFMWVILTELFIGIVIYLIMLSASFTKRLHEIHIETEKAQAEANKYKYATLKNQVNPHFLFNSLNVLSGIIYKDVDKADEFIGKLANIYRYVLDVQDEEVVNIDREIGFAEDYLALQSLRFGENLKYKINAKSDKFIIPMALQIAIENALKHNEISDDKTLSIEISNDDRYLIISNNLNPKFQKTESHEIGLKNIIARYQHLSDVEVKIIKTESKFEVRLPLLNLIA